MQLSNPSLRRAYDELTKRRQNRNVMQVFGTQTPGVVRHTAPLGLTYVRSGKLYMTIRYCGSCKLGYPVDLEHEVPAEMPHAHALGVKLAREWSVECNEAV